METDGLESIVQSGHRPKQTVFVPPQNHADLYCLHKTAQNIDSISITKALDRSSSVPFLGSVTCARPPLI